jgi:hypothetical protein
MYVFLVRPEDPPNWGPGEVEGRAGVHIQVGTWVLWPPLRGVRVKMSYLYSDFWESDTLNLLWETPYILSIPQKYQGGWNTENKFFGGGDPPLLFDQKFIPGVHLGVGR